MCLVVTYWNGGEVGLMQDVVEQVDMGHMAWCAGAEAQVGKGVI